MHYHLLKKERLKRKKAINTLFQQGKRWKGRCTVLYYSPQQGHHVDNHQALFSVPKSRLKRAVDRNKIKRRLREAYRQHKHLMPTHPTLFFTLGYVYTKGKGMLASYQELVKDVQDSITFLIANS